MAHNDYYKKLTESLNRKYLTEAWSDNMPDWLKPRLGLLANLDKPYDEVNKYVSKSKNPNVQNTYTWNRVNEYRKSKFGVSDDRFEYRKPRNGPAAKNLFRGFRDEGIDLTKAFFVDDTDNPPTKKNDPRTIFPNVGIWHFPNGQVYAMGINDLEKLDLYGSTYRDKIFSKIPVKELSAMSDHFCYIEGSTVDKTTIPNKRTERREYKDWMKNNRSEVRATQNEIDNVWEYGMSKNPKDVTRRRYDMSGYYTVPSSQRLRDELDKRRAVVWSKWFKDIEEKLVDFKDDLDSTMLSRPWDDMDFMSELQNAASQYRQAIYYYKTAMERLERLISNYGENSDEFLSRITDRCKDPLDDAENYIDSARNYLDKYVLTRIDF